MPRWETGRPRPVRQSAPDAGRRRLGDARKGPAYLGEKARRARRLAHEPRDQIPRRAPPSPRRGRRRASAEALPPTAELVSRVRTPTAAPETGSASAPGPQQRADEPARGDVEGGLGERVGRPHATQRSMRGRWPRRSTARSAKHTATHGRPPGALERAEAANEEPEQRRLRIAVGREPGHALDGPRPLPQPLEVLAHADEGRHDVEVVDPNQLAPPGVEEDQLAQREQLEGAAEARARPARRLGHAPQLADTRACRSRRAGRSRRARGGRSRSPVSCGGHVRLRGQEEAELPQRLVVRAPVPAHAAPSAPGRP